MKLILLSGAAAIAVAAMAPAIAQTANSVTTMVGGHGTAKAERVHSRADVQGKVAKHFARADADRDGFVTKAEADAAAQAMRTRIQQRMTERGGKRGMGAALFERMDANRDGSVSRVEFDAATAHRQHRLAERKLRRSGHRSGMIGAHMFAMADTNKDGRVALQEAQAAALQHFDMADADRDGMVTRDERRQMRQRMRDERRPG